MVNTGGTASDVTFKLPFAVRRTATSQVLTGGELDSNTPTTPNIITPQRGSINVAETFTYDAPAFSVSVLTLTVA